MLPRKCSLPQLSQQSNQTLGSIACIIPNCRHCILCPHRSLANALIQQSLAGSFLADARRIHSYNQTPSITGKRLQIAQIGSPFIAHETAFSLNDRTFGRAPVLHRQVVSYICPSDALPNAHHAFFAWPTVRPIDRLRGNFCDYVIRLAVCPALDKPHSDHRLTTLAMTMGC